MFRKPLNLFTDMSVQENLLLGAYAVKEKETQLETLDYIFELFPRLEERKDQLAGTMSGGERKMLAIARGMMSNPTLMLVDEPSLGLQPNLTYDVFDALLKLRQTGCDHSARGTECECHPRLSPIELIFLNKARSL